MNYLAMSPKHPAIVHFAIATTLFTGALDTLYFLSIYSPTSASVASAGTENPSIIRTSANNHSQNTRHRDPTFAVANPLILHYNPHARIRCASRSHGCAGAHARYPA